MRTACVVFPIWMTAIGCSFLAAQVQDERPRSRSVEIQYVTHVKDVQEGTGELRLWAPLPSSNKHQQITELKVVAPFEYDITTEKKYGNRMIFLSVPKPPSHFDVEVRFHARRFENTAPRGRGTNKNSMGLFLKPNRLVPISEDIRSMSMSIVQGKKAQADKARALYEHTLDHMRYDKAGSGWGRGDFRYACKAGRGNCSDFHSYFIGLCRNAGIPAYFEIGLSIPRERGEGKTGGYHCWGHFWDGSQWVPVDISEADKHPEKKEYFSSSHCENRVAFSIGRDIILEPSQKGEPLNFFIYPYAEVDGRPHKNVSKESSYRDL